MEDYLSRAEHNEFVKRIDEEEIRQNKRLDMLEQNVKEIAELTLTVKELAVNMRHMAKEQEKQGQRLEQIEARDGDKWRRAVSYVLTAIGGAILTLVLSRIGLGG